MECQSRHVADLVTERTVRSYIDEYYVRIGFKLKFDMAIGMAARAGNTLKRPFAAEGAYLTKDQLREAMKPLRLITGDRVRVRPLTQILQTLDLQYKLGGCYFLDDMAAYCGGEYTVEKKVGLFFDELGYSTLKTNDVVLLAGVTCSGKLPVFKYTCGRSCLYFWKEAWLEKIGHGPEPGQEQPSREEEMVRVRAKKEIMKTLDKEGKYDGCLFMETMEEYCGREFAVEKRVDVFFNEHNYAMAKTRDVTILKGVRCSGGIAGLEKPCDRYCSILWKNAWLEKG